MEAYNYQLNDLHAQIKKYGEDIKVLQENKQKRAKQIERLASLQIPIERDQTYFVRERFPNSKNSETESKTGKPRDQAMEKVEIGMEPNMFNKRRD